MNNDLCLNLETLLSHYQNIPVLHFDPAGGSARVSAIMGGAHLDGSFKNILGSGMMLLAREKGLLRPGQAVIETTSGSMGEGLAVAGRMLGHHVTLVSDAELPDWTACRIKAVGADLVLVKDQDPVMGWQGSREDKVRELLAQNPDLFWFDQNNNMLNPEAYTRWLVPMLARKINPNDYVASAFCVGSGGHFSALSAWLKQANPKLRTYAIDRAGSLTFGNRTTTPSQIRGMGNQNKIPRVIGSHMHLVDGVVAIDDQKAFSTCRELGSNGCFIGGSAGAAYAGALEIARQLDGPVLTLFPDRGDIYANTIWNDDWMNNHGFMTERKEYGIHTYKRA